MSRQLFYNGHVYRDHRFETLCVLSENGVITEIGEWISAPEAERIDLKGRRLVPGFLDIHTHGAAGVDVNSADPDGYEKISARATVFWDARALRSIFQPLKAIFPPPMPTK